MPHLLPPTGSGQDNHSTNMEDLCPTCVRSSEQADHSLQRLRGLTGV